MNFNITVAFLFDNINSTVFRNLIKYYGVFLEIY